MIESEKVIERRLVECVKEQGGMCVKLLCDQMSGLPDRLCLMPNGKVAFAELKTTGKKPRKIQVVLHEELRRLGFKVAVIDTKQGVEEFIDTMIDECE